MIQFPEGLGYFSLSSYIRTEGKYFNDLDKDFLNINKNNTQQDRITYNVSLILCINEFSLFEEFYNIDIFNGTLPFNVSIMKDKLVDINCSIVSDLSVSYSINKVSVSFNIIENYELLS